MNYFLIILIIGIAGFAYYQHNQDEQEVTDLQQQVTILQAKASTVVQVKPPVPAAPAVPVIQPEIKVVAPDTHSAAIDEAARAAAAASSAPATDPNDLGTVNTLDGRTYHNCKVLKVEEDGVTFNHDDGITKVLFPFMPPDLQKRFNYDPQKAVEKAAAQTRYDEQQEAATNAASAPANP